jgi:hypothetical protein
MLPMSLEAAAVDLRAAIESAPELDAAAFARRTRNAIAQAVLAAAFAVDEELAPPEREPPLDELAGRVGQALAAELAAVYDGGAGWTSHAIDALEPLHALAAR